MSFSTLCGYERLDLIGKSVNILIPSFLRKEHQDLLSTKTTDFSNRKLYLKNLTEETETVYNNKISMVTKSNFLISLTSSIKFISSTAFAENFLFLAKFTKNKISSEPNLVFLITDLKGVALYKSVNFDRLLGGCIKIGAKNSIFYSIKEIYSKKIKNISMSSKNEKTKSYKMNENNEIFIEQILKEYRDFKPCHLRPSESDFSGNDDASFNSKIIEGDNFLVKVEELLIQRKRLGFNIYLKKDDSCLREKLRLKTISVDQFGNDGKIENYELDKDFLPDVEKGFLLDPKDMNYIFELPDKYSKNKQFMRQEADKKLHSNGESEESKVEESVSSDQEEISNSLDLNNNDDLLKDISSESLEVVGDKSDMEYDQESVQNEEILIKLESEYKVNLAVIQFRKFNFKSLKVEKVPDEYEKVSQFQKALSNNMVKESLLAKDEDLNKLENLENKAKKPQSDAMEKQLKTKLTSKEKINIFTTLNIVSYFYFVLISVSVISIFAFILNNLTDIHESFKTMNLSTKSTFLETQVQYHLLEYQLLMNENYTGFLGDRQKAIEHSRSQLNKLIEEILVVEEVLDKFKIFSNRLELFELNTFSFPFINTEGNIFEVYRRFQYQRSVEKQLLSYINSQDFESSLSEQTNFLLKSFNNGSILKFYRSWIYKKTVENVAESINFISIIMFSICFLVVVIFSIVINILYQKILKLKENYLKLFFKVNEEFIYASILNCDLFLRSFEEKQVEDISNDLEMSVNKVTEKQKKKDIKSLKAGFSGGSKKDNSKISTEQIEILKYLVSFFFVIVSILIFGFVIFLTDTFMWSELSIYSYAISTNFIYKNVILNSVPFMALYQDKTTVMNADGVKYFNFFSNDLNFFDDNTVNVSF